MHDKHEPIRNRKWLIVARCTLGLIFLLSGSNGFLEFMPPPPVTGTAAALMQALHSTAYFFPLLHGMELALGALLLAGRWVPLALLALTPIIVNIAAFHLFLAPAGLPIVAIILLAFIPLVVSQWGAFAKLRRRAGVGVVGYVLGGLLILSGLMGLFGATPPPANAWAAGFMHALTMASYLVPLICVVELTAGVLLVLGYGALGLAVVAPLMVHILGYRLVVATPGMLAVTAAMVLATAWLAWRRRDAWRPLAGREAARQPTMSYRLDAG